VADYYIEATAVQRHILQCEADSYDEALDKLRECVKRGSCQGMQILDSDKPWLVDEEGGQADDGPVWMVGPVFGESREWMVRAADELTRLASEGDEGG
jgi:hypothetical protein